MMSVGEEREILSPEITQIGGSELADRRSAPAGLRRGSTPGECRAGSGLGRPTAVLDGLKVLAARDLIFDYVGILPRHLEHVPVLAQGIPDLRIVIDHLGKPPIVGRGFEPWGSLLASAARMPNVFAKMSGLDVGESDRWTAADIAPYVDHARSLFGPDRLMFGSHWPVAILRGGYAKVWHETNVALARLSRDERERILGGTAVDVYRLRITETP